MKPVYIHEHARVGTVYAGAFTCKNTLKDRTVRALFHVSIRPSQDCGHYSSSIIIVQCLTTNLCGPIKIKEARRTKDRSSIQ